MKSIKSARLIHPSQSLIIGNERLKGRGRLRPSGRLPSISQRSSGHQRSASPSLSSFMSLFNIEHRASRRNSILFGRDSAKDCYSCAGIWYSVKCNNRGCPRALKCHSQSLWSFFLSLALRSVSLSPHALDCLQLHCFYFLGVFFFGFFTDFHWFMEEFPFLLFSFLLFLPLTRCFFYKLKRHITSSRVCFADF